LHGYGKKYPYICTAGEKRGGRLGGLKKDASILRDCKKWHVLLEIKKKNTLIFRDGKKMTCLFAWVIKR
jgi:hypothetical protein